MSKHCPYCGQAKIIRIFPTSHFKLYGNPKYGETSLPLPQLYFQCLHCGFQLTPLEISKATEYADRNGPTVRRETSRTLPEEERILQQAWAFMQEKQWESALNTLFSRSYPLEHPLEFMVYRNICQTAPLLTCKLAVLEDRIQKLDILLNNISRLSYYFAEDNKEEYQTLKKLFDALLFLGSLPVKHHCVHVAEGPVSLTYYRRAAILSTFADFLETCTVGNQKDTAEYLKMATVLLHKSLESARENNRLLPCGLSRLKLPPEVRRQINSRIRQFNAEIIGLDPNYAPTDPLPEPKYLSAGIEKAINVARWICIFLAIPAIVLLGFILVEPSIAGMLYAAVTNPVYIIVTACIIVISCLPIFILAKANSYHDDKKTASNTDSATNSPKYLDQKQRCLYCGQKELLTPIVIKRSLIYSNILTNLDKNGSTRIMTDNCYKCANCGISIPYTELEKENKSIREALDKDSCNSAAKETDSLNQAWQHMQQRDWSEALECLYQPLPPFAHPLEIMICRNICRAAITIAPEPQKSIFNMEVSTVPRELTKARERYDALEPLEENVKRIAYYLPNNAIDINFASLKSLYGIFQLFVSQPFEDCSSPYPYKIIDYTALKRLKIARSFAELLESQADSDSGHRADYINMAIRLLQNCQTVTLAKKGQLQEMSLEEYSAACDTDRLLIEEKIQTLRERLS
ncbi:MAG: hypothetical protein Q4F00_09150 [bacterium]|nr:hypothetical protein [bacterium]